MGEPSNTPKSWIKDKINRQIKPEHIQQKPTDQATNDNQNRIADLLSGLTKSK